MTAEVKSRGDTVRISATRGRYQLLARLVGKKQAKAILRGRPNTVLKDQGKP